MTRYTDPGFSAPKLTALIPSAPPAPAEVAFAMRAAHGKRRFTPAEAAAELACGRRQQNRFAYHISIR